MIGCGVIEGVVLGVLGRSFGIPAKVQDPAGSDVELRKQAFHRCAVTIESFDLRWPELLDLDHDQFIAGTGLGCFVGSQRRLKVW